MNLTKHQGGLVDIGSKSVVSPIGGETYRLTYSDKSNMSKTTKTTNRLIDVLSSSPLDVRREELLHNLSKKQDFWVWDGLKEHKWEIYKEFKPEYVLRQVLDDEVVIEFDCDDLEIVVKAISGTGLNLLKAGIIFEYWDFENARSPHLHIHNLPIKHYSEQQRKTFKKLFIARYVPLEYLAYVDKTLIDPKHLIALEWSQHWKSLLPKEHPKYKPTGIKRLISEFQPLMLVGEF